MRQRLRSFRRSPAIADGQRPVPPIMVFMFYAYVVIEYVRPQEIFPFIGLIRPGLLSLAILGIFSLSRIDADVYKDKSIRLFIAFVILCWFGVIHGVNTYWAFQNSLTMTLYLLAAVIPMCLIVRTEKSLMRFLIFWVAAHCYIAAYGVLHAGRGPGSFLSDENDLALVLNMALPYTYYLATWRGFGGAARAALVFAVAVLLAGVIATASRGGFVGLAATAMLIVILSKKKIRNAALVLIVAAIAYALVPPQYKAEVASINNKEDSTRQGRIHQWKVGWDMYLDNPVIGVGTGNYPWRVSEYEVKRADFDPGGRLYGGRAAHSMYFTLLPEQGTVGTVLFLLILLEVVRKLRHSMIATNSSRDRGGSMGLADPAARATIVSLGAYLITGTFISVLYYPPFWYAVGIAFCIAIQNRKPPLDEDPSTARGGDEPVAGRDSNRAHQARRVGGRSRG